MRERVRNWFDALARFATRTTFGGFAWMLAPLFVGACAGAGGWELANLGRVKEIDANKLTDHEFLWAFACVMAGIVAIGGLAGILSTWTRARRPFVPFSAAVLGVTMRAAPLAGIPFVVALTLPNIEKESPKQTLFFAAVAAACMVVGGYAWSGRGRALDLADDEPPPKRVWLRRVASALGLLAVLGVWAAYGYFFSKLSITNHHALNSRTTDLGYYDNIFYQSLHGHFLGCSWIRAGWHGSAHFDPILVVLSPLYMIYPHAELLLVLQAVWLGAGVVPVYLLARAKGVSRMGGLALAIAYALFPALHGANMYEFHSLSLLATVMLWLVYFAETERWKGYWLVIIPALLTREDVSLLLCCWSLYLLMCGRRDAARMGVLTILVSLVYFVVVKRFLMTSSDILSGGKDSYGFAYYYEDLIPNHNGVPGMLLSILANPSFALKTITLEPKLEYVLLLFLPMLFLPFVARPGRVALIYGLLFTLLATRSAVYQIHFQYSCILIPFVFALTPLALARIRETSFAWGSGVDGRRLARALIPGCLVATLIISWKFGAIWENRSFHGGFGPIARSLTPEQDALYSWIREQADKIPISARVGATNRVGPHISNRMNAFFWPERTDVDWVFIDEAELKSNEQDKSRKLLDRDFKEVARDGKFAVYKRNPRGR